MSRLVVIFILLFIFYLGFRISRKQVLGIRKRRDQILDRLRRDATDDQKI